MSTCLDDVRLQAVADDEAPEADRAHVQACAGCRERVREIRRSEERFAGHLAAIPVPPDLGARVTAVARPPAGRRGATTLRPPAPAWRPRPAWALAGTAVGAAVAIIVFVVLPSVDPGTRLGAAEILDRSIQALGASGTERLEYELSVAGPASMPVERGSYRIEQVIDHESGRYRLARFAPDGTLENGIAEDPVAGTREAFVRHQGQAYRFRFAVEPGAHVELWQLQRRYAEWTLQLLRAGGQAVSLETGAAGAHYVVELPPAAGPAPAGGLFDVSHARAVVDAADYHLVELSVTGIAMGEPVSIDYRLIGRDVRAPGNVDPAELALPDDGEQTIELEGPGSRQPAGDIMALLLREVARTRP